MTTKQEVFGHFKYFSSYVSNQFCTTIITIRSDNGSEFINQNFKSFLSQHGVLHQRSCIHNSQQNARVDRKHRHLLEIARALRFQSALPYNY